MKKFLIAISFLLLFSRNIVVFATEFDNDYTKIAEELYDIALSEEEIKQDVYSKYEDVIKIELTTLEETPELIEVFEEKITSKDAEPLDSFPLTIPYNKDGYNGELKRQDDTLNISEKNIESKAVDLERYETKYYSNLEENDVSLIEKTIEINGISMDLKSLTFVISSYRNIGDSKVPASYDAIAKYSYMYTEEMQSTNYIATIMYSNNLKRISSYKAIITYEDKAKKLEYERRLAENEKVKETKDITEPKKEVEEVESFKEEIQKKTDPTAFFKALKTIFMIIVFLVIIAVAIFLVFALYYYGTNTILVFSTSFNGTELLGRTKIIKNDNGLEIGLTKFNAKTDSSVYKLEIPKKISKKYNEKIVNVSLIKNKKKYIKQIYIKEDAYKKVEHEVSF